MRRDTLDDAFDRAIDALRAGRSFEAVLASEPAYARELRPLLESARAAGVLGPGAPPAPARLAEHYAFVRAAVERARDDDRRASRTAPAPPSWWRRKVAFASLSLPVGAVIALALGAGGAAAASVVVARGEVTALASAVTPEWAEHAITGTDGERITPLGAGDAPGAPHTVPTDVPGFENRPTAMEASGIVGDVNGNTFTLTMGDTAYHVNLDADTVVTGEIADGATATVRGDVTARKNLHAREIIVTQAPVKADPVDERTPRPTRTPRPEATPPGQGNDGNTPQGTPRNDGAPTKAP